MGKRIFTLVLVVVVGVLAGVGIVAKQAREPLMRELLRQQATLIQSQRRIEKMITSEIESEENFDEAGGDRIPAVLQRQRDLEARVETLEAQMKGFQAVLKPSKGSGGDVRQAPPEDLSKVYDIPAAHSPVRGSKDAPVTIVEFVDFQCPFCARFHPPVTEVLKAYPDRVNYILKNFPLSFHPQAKPAAKAAFAAGEQGKYWEMADTLLENGKALSEGKYEEFAGKLGLDVKKFMDDYKNKDAQWEEYIRKDMTLASQVDVRGTPTFYINGRKTNARDFDSFKSEIDRILNKGK